MMCEFVCVCVRTCVCVNVSMWLNGDRFIPYQTKL